MARPRFRAYPNNGTITISDGETYPLNVRGNFINVKSADQQFKILLDGQEELQAAQNRRFRLSENDTFNLVEIVNDSGNSLTFQLEIGFGGVESDDVSITGAVAVKNDATDDELQVVTKAGTKLNVDDADTQGKLDDILALLQSRVDQRAPLTTLEGATFVSAVNAVVTICTAANNTNGVIIRTSNWIAGGIAPSGIRLDNTKFINPELNGFGDTYVGELKNIYIPAGVKVELVSSGVNRDLNAWYEVL